MHTNTSDQDQPDAAEGPEPEDPPPPIAEDDRFSVPWALTDDDPHRPG